MSNQQYFELRDIQSLHESDFQPKEETGLPMIILEVLNELKNKFKILIKIRKLYDSKPFVLLETFITLISMMFFSKN